MTSWWRSAVVYQVYVRSFLDGDGDGVGDLAGLTAGLDAVARLGVDGLWLTPVYRSPNSGSMSRWSATSYPWSACGDR